MLRSNGGRDAMITIGRRIYGLGAIALGLVEARFGGFSGDWLPVPAHLPGYHLFAYATAAVLILAGLAINLPRAGAIAALVLAALFGTGMLGLILPHTLTTPTDWGGWQAVAESTAMALGGVLAYALARGVGDAPNLPRIARLGFGACLVVFGVSHFAYAKFTASLVPTWLPPSQLFWAYATGVAQIAAGLAILSGVQARLAAILLTAMYAVFGLLVHIPSVIAAPASHDNWAENAVNLLLLGAAWCVADSLKAETIAAP
ncbi:MAG: DoxX family protein [Phenylobacterium sp.]|nr:MAG: DoxX family protein [Phenylobacterium sp.]